MAGRTVARHQRTRYRHGLAHDIARSRHVAASVLSCWRDRLASRLFPLWRCSPRQRWAGLLWSSHFGMRSSGRSCTRQSSAWSSFSSFGLWSRMLFGSQACPFTVYLGGRMGRIRALPPDVSVEDSRSSSLQRFEACATMTLRWRDELRESSPAGGVTMRRSLRNVSGIAFPICGPKLGCSNKARSRI